VVAAYVTLPEVRPPPVLEDSQSLQFLFSSPALKGLSQQYLTLFIPLSNSFLPLYLSPACSLASAALGPGIFFRSDISKFGRLCNASLVLTS
jgi:hypothetical protein